MPLEIKGGYSILLDLIYAHSGRLADDSRFIAGALGCSVRKWNTIRARLIELGKIKVENGIISNFQADLEIENCGKYQEKQAENRSRPNKNKRIQSPNRHLRDYKKEDTPLPPQKRGDLKSELGEGGEADFLRQALDDGADCLRVRSYARSGFQLAEHKGRKIAVVDHREDEFRAAFDVTIKRLNVSVWNRAYADRKGILRPENRTLRLVAGGSA